MKKHLHLPFLTSFLLVFVCNNLIAQKAVPGKTLNVWLSEGIALKSAPAEKSKTIVNLPYGTAVKLLKGTEKPTPFSVELSSEAFKTPYKLNGNWVKVEYAGRQGYAFDGFLSAMPALKTDSHGFAETEDSYLKRNYGVLKIQKRAPKKGTKETSIYYKNGAITSESGADGCTDHQLYLNNISLNEAVLFQKVLYKDLDAAQNIKIEQVKGGGVKISS
ncbi:MAG TPA: hypothetical protein VIM77_03730, partial [Mucilaginibacter sp.]